MFRGNTPLNTNCRKTFKEGEQLLVWPDYGMPEVIWFATIGNRIQDCMSLWSDLVLLLLSTYAGRDTTIILACDSGSDHTETSVLELPERRTVRKLMKYTV